ncbi:MAG: response regulator [Deltaproteobacteria bacterium]|nr:response regulator [Deltaproteobacteria bacterium]MBW2041275.1 response regulator [Deltaproteobacteria bacterium]MBW2131251.1 response regulator [Deltaproteobacteria bacterium]
MDESVTRNPEDQKKRLKIGEFLLLSGMINRQTLDHALKLQKTQKKKLGQILMELGVIDDVVIAKALSYQLKISCVRLKNVFISENVLSLVPAAVARQNLLIPTQVKDKKLVVAMANPLEQSFIDNLRNLIKMPLKITVAPEQEVRVAIAKYYPESPSILRPKGPCAANGEIRNQPRVSEAAADKAAIREGTKEKGLKTILVVDDNDIVLQTMEKILAAEGYHVATAQNGVEAMASIAQGKPDLIITDYLMPEMDGIALIQQLKSKTGTRSIPILMLTAKDEVDTEVSVFEAGVDDYLVKPVSRKRLLARVNRIVRRFAGDES